MSIDMNLEESREQADSIDKGMKERIEGYDGLLSAMTSLNLTSTELKGKAYDSMREYFEEVLKPIVKGGRQLSELISKKSKELPERYVGEVYDKSLRESELEERIERLKRKERKLRNLLSNEWVRGRGEYEKSLRNLIEINEDEERYTEELLNKLRRFNESTRNITAEIDELSRTIKEGLMSIKRSNCYNSMSGEFDIGKIKDEEWLKRLKYMVEKREREEEKEIKRELMVEYGFEESTIKLLMKVKRGIDEKFPDLDNYKRFYIFNRVIGEINYNGFKWNGTAGELGKYFYEERDVELENGTIYTARIPYKIGKIYELLGLSNKEYLQLRYELDIQHRFSGKLDMEGNEMFGNINENEKFKEEYAKYKSTYGKELTEDDFIKKWNRNREVFYKKGDFTHQAITMSAMQHKAYFRLANVAGILYKAPNPHKFVDELSGWRGDATNQAGKKPSLKWDDYRADLDAVNILNLYDKDKNRDWIEIYNEYYGKLQAGKINRARMFNKNLGFKYVEEEIKKLRVIIFNYLNIENIDDLKNINPVGYNFIKNLEEENNEFIEYIKTGD